jgi:hypothetical protein
MTDVINSKSSLDVVSGVTAGGTVNLTIKADAIKAVLAVVKASGAPATKFLLASTTDYTIAGSVLTCVTDQSANTLIVIYQ